MYVEFRATVDIPVELEADVVELDVVALKVVALELIEFGNF